MRSNNRNLPILRLILTFLIATVIFLSAFLIGYGVSYIKYQDISQKQEEIRYNLLGLELESEFLEYCDSLVFSSISGELDEMGAFISILEERFGKTDKKVIEQKVKYTLLEVQHFLNVRKYKENCDKNISTILFFYSNFNEFERESEKTGYILTSLKSKSPDRIMTYSFDYDLDINMIKILKSIYAVDFPNTLIIDEKMKLVDINNIDEIEEYLA